jgi:DNA-binding Lrp family transcriptional regulator
LRKRNHQKHVDFRLKRQFVRIYYRNPALETLTFFGTDSIPYKTFFLGRRLLYKVSPYNHLDSPENDLSYTLGEDTMPVAYVLVTCEIGFEDKAMEQISKLPCVEEVNRVTGVYDIVVKLSGSDLDLLREVIGKDMVKIREISFTHTLMADQIV